MQFGAEALAQAWVYAYDPAGAMVQVIVLLAYEYVLTIPGAGIGNTVELTVIVMGPLVALAPLPHPIERRGAYGLIVKTQVACETRLLATSNVLACAATVITYGLYVVVVVMVPVCVV